MENCCVYPEGDVVCKALPEDLGRRHDASEVQSSGGKKTWDEDNRHIADLALN